MINVKGVAQEPDQEINFLIAENTQLRHHIDKLEIAVSELKTLVSILISTLIMAVSLSLLLITKEVSS